MNTIRTWARRYSSFGRSMLGTAAVGALVFVAIVVFAGERLQQLEILLQWTIWTLVPLMLALRCAPAGRPEARLIAWVTRAYPPVAALASTAIFLPSGRLAAALTVPYFALGLLAFLDGAGRTFRRGWHRPEEWALDLGHFYFAFAGFWFVAYRLGARPLGVSDLIVLLATVHYLNAGYVALFLTGLTGRWLAARRRFGRRLILIQFACGLAFPILVSFGIVYSPVLELVSAYGMEFGVFLLAALTVFVVVPEIRGWPARIGLFVSSLAVFVGMCLAITYTLKINPIPYLVITHGYVQAFGFGLVGLMAWAAVGPLAEGAAERAEPAESAALPRALPRGALRIPLPVGSFAEVGQALVQVADQLAAARDRRGAFAVAYAVMFGDMARRHAEGVFADRATFERFAVGLANRYFDALRAHEIDSADQTASWKLVLDDARAGSGSVSQDLVAAMMPHLRHDHSLALADAWTAGGPDVDRSGFRPDYDAMNDSLFASTDRVQARIAAIYGHGLGTLDGLFGRLDELIVNRMIREQRAQAWQDAVVLAAAGPAENLRLRGSIDEAACAEADRFLSRARSGAMLAVVEGSLDSQRPLPPGRLGLPWIGESLAFARDPSAMLRERAQRHGRVFKTRLLGKNVVALLGPEAFALLTDESRFVRSGANPRHWSQLMAWKSSPLLDGPERLRRKRLLLSALRTDAVARYVILIEPLIERYVERWQGLGSFRWVPEFKSLSYALCDALFQGGELRVRDEAERATLERCYTGFRSAPIPLPFTAFGRALRARDTLLAGIGTAIRRHLEAPGSDVLSELLAARDPDGVGIAHEDLAAEVLQLYFASFGAIYSVLSCAVIALNQHRHVRDQVAAEVTTAAPSGSIGLVLDRLAYTQRFTKEVRRAFPLVATTLFARVRRDLEIGGYRVPRDWVAMGCIDASMQLEETFPRPTEFDPDRFLPGREGTQPNAYVPHGGGPPESHHCAGEQLADALFAVVVARLVRDCEWSLPAQRLDLDPAEGVPIPRDRLQVTLRKAT